MYNFSSMSGWHQQSCDQIFYPEGCNVSVKRLCALPKQKDSLCTIISRHASFLSPICFLCNHLSSDCCPWWQTIPACPCPSYCDSLIYVCWGEAHCYLVLHVDRHAGLGLFSSATRPRSVIYKSVTLLWTELRSVQHPGTVQTVVYSLLPAKCFPGPFSVLK